MFDYSYAFVASESSHYLGVVVGPAPQVALAFSPVAQIWTEVFGHLAAGTQVLPGTEARSGAGAQSSSSGGGGRIGGRGAASPAGNSRQRMAAGRQPLVASPPLPDYSTRGGRGSGDDAGLARGAVRLTKRMMRLVVQTGDTDLLYQVLEFLSRHESELELSW
jgi:hypothetical protein